MRDSHISDETPLSDLVASRLCHDLVNPLGAIGNGVELLEMTGKADGPEVDLIRDAVRAAEARIRLFRLAFGSAGVDQTTSAREAAGAIEGYFAQSRIEVIWVNGTDQPRRMIKLAALMLLCGETALPMGGTLRGELGVDGMWQIEATGPRLNVDEDLWCMLRFGSPAEGRALRPADAHFPVLLEASRAIDHSVNYVVDGEHLKITLA